MHKTYCEICGEQHPVRTTSEMIELYLDGKLPDYVALITVEGYHTRILGEDIELSPHGLRDTIIYAGYAPEFHTLAIRQGVTPPLFLAKLSRRLLSWAWHGYIRWLPVNRRRAACFGFLRRLAQRLDRQLWRRTKMPQW